MKVYHNKKYSFCAYTIYRDKIMNQDIDHFDFPVPYNSELAELELKPYRTNSELLRKIDYIFRHPYNPFNSEYVDISTSGSRQLTSDMGNVAVSMVRHFLLYPQRYNHSLDTIHLQILVRMWKQLFKHVSMQNKSVDKYMATKMKLLSIENNLLEHLLQTCNNKDYIQHNDDMVKKRTYMGKPVELRGRVGVSEKNLNYYDSLV